LRGLETRTGVWASLPAGMRILGDEPMSRHTTFGIGGQAAYFASADSEADLVSLVLWARQHGQPYRVIGAGANLLVSDAGVQALIIENRVAHVTLHSREACIRTGSGSLIADVAQYVAKRGWAGLEWAVGVPGTVGGALVGNAGAFGGNIGGLVRSVTVLDALGQVRALSPAECGFVYRSSRFKTAQDQVILGAELGLEPADPAALEVRVADYTVRRAASQPKEPSAGSVFKRTAEHPAGWLIEQVGLKGARVGGAQISPRHGNFIVNLGGATAGDVAELIELARGKVRERFATDLELEIEWIGPAGPIWKPGWGNEGRLV
jgi:UDP-N-acetylmuramate dehydrogenase